MSQLTYLDTLRMEDVLAEACHILAEAAQVARGEKVKITFYPQDGQGPFSHCYPFRVAAYAHTHLGARAAACEATTVSFTTQGVTLAYQPTAWGYRAFIQVLLAYSSAEQRRYSRQLRKLYAAQQKGGQAGE